MKSSRLDSLDTAATIKDGGATTEVFCEVFFSALCSWKRIP
jgi:hypothetical protein